MRSTVYATIISIAAVCMLVLPAPIAFADGSSTLSVSDNTTSADYVSVDLYLKSGSEYVQVSGNSFSGGSITVTSETSGGLLVYYYDAEDVTISSADLYVIVTSSTPGSTYGLTYSITQSGSYNVSPSSYTMKSGSNIIPTMGGSGSFTVVSGTAYPLELIASLDDYRGDRPTFPTIGVTLYAEDTVTSTVLDSSNTITTNIHYKNVQEATTDVRETNNADPNTGAFDSQGGTYYIKPGNETSDTTSVYITDSNNNNDTTISSNLVGGSSFNAEVVIPSGQSFVVATTITSVLLAEAEITISLTDDTGSTRSIKLENAGTHYVYISGNTLKSTTNINNVEWMTYSGNVTISLSGAAQGYLLGYASVSVQMVFQK